MLGVIQGFAVIGIVIAVGVLLGYTRWLGDAGPAVLTKLAFWVATPALMFTIMSRADLGILASSQFVVTAIGMVAMTLLYAAIGALMKWGAGPTTVGAMGASFVNSGNLGIPIAIYVLGDATLVAPVMLTQQLIMAPVFMAVLDIASRGPDAPPLRWWSLVLRPFRNPVVIGSLSGLAFSALGLEVPGFIFDPLELIGAMSVPAVLLAFGMSMRESSVPFRGPERWQVLTATVLKSFVHPVAAWLLGAYVFRVDPATLLAVVVTAALPSAQNVFTYASQYGVATRLAKEVVLVTTLLAVPVVFLGVVLLHP